MFDKIGQAAEKLAVNVSRRAFLGRLGQGAMAVAGVLAGLAALPEEARAGTRILYQCAYVTPYGAGCGGIYGCGHCPQHWNGCRLSGQWYLGFC